MRRLPGAGVFVVTKVSLVYKLSHLDAESWGKYRLENVTSLPKSKVLVVCLVIIHMWISNQAFTILVDGISTQTRISPYLLPKFQSLVTTKYSLEDSEV